MKNNQLLELFNIKDKRIKLKENNFLEVIYIDNQKINFIKGTLKYDVKKCINCKSKNLYKHGYDKVKIQIPNISNIKTFILLDKQRYICNCCKKTFTVKCRDYKKHSRKSYTLKNTVDYYLVKNKISQTDISDITNLSRSTIKRQLESYNNKIIINKKTLPKVLCIDEVAGVKSNQGKYNCVIYDAENKKVKDVLITRRQNYVENYLKSYTKEARKQVEFFVTDMYDVYIRLAKKYFPEAKIVLDRFHIVNLLIRTLDNIRINLMNKYRKDSLEYRVLKKFNKKLKKRYKDISYNYQKYTFYKQFQCEYDILNYMLNLSEDLGTIYYLLQTFYVALDNKDIEIFKEIFTEEIYNKNPIIYTCFKTLKKYNEYICNSIIYPYSNGILENANSKNKAIKKKCVWF